MREAGTHRSTAEVIEGVRLRPPRWQRCTTASAPTLADLQDAAVTLVGQWRALLPSLRRWPHVNVGTSDWGTAEGRQPHVDSGRFRPPDGPAQAGEVQDHGCPRGGTLDLRENRHVKSADAAFLGPETAPRFATGWRVLGVEFAKPLPTGQQQATWAERWKLQWSPESEIALVEAVLARRDGRAGDSFPVQATPGRRDRHRYGRRRWWGTPVSVGLAASMDLARQRLQALAAVSTDLKAIAHAAGAAEHGRALRRRAAVRPGAAIAAYSTSYFVQGGAAGPCIAGPRQCRQSGPPRISWYPSTNSTVSGDRRRKFVLDCLNLRQQQYVQAVT